MKKGMTTVELVISVALATGLLIFLFQVITLVNEILVINDHKTIINNDVALFNYELNTMLRENTVSSIDEISKNNYQVNYQNGTNDIIKLENNTLTIGDLTKTLDDLTISDIRINRVITPLVVPGTGKIDSILIIEIDIKSERIDYGTEVKAIYQYSSITNILG